MRDIVPLGGDFIVNSTRLNAQSDPYVTTLNNGNFVVVYRSADTAWLGESVVRGRIFSSDGAPIGDDFLLISGEGGNNYRPVVTALPDGGFLTCWNIAAGSAEIWARSFDADGQPRGPEYRITNPEQFSQFGARCATQSDGRTLVVWDSLMSPDKAIFGCFINPDGQTIGGRFELETSTHGPANVTVTALSDGRYFIAYSALDSVPNANTYDVFGRFLSADGSPVGEEILIPRAVIGAQTMPGIAELADGRIIVTWSSWNGDVPTVDYYDVKARVFRPDGTPAGNEYTVTTLTEDNQSGSQVLALPSGQLMCVWHDSYTDGNNSYGILRGRYLGSDGEPIGTDFILNSSFPIVYWDGSHTVARYPSLSVSPDGRILVVWQVEDNSISDMSGGSIRGRFFFEVQIIDGTDAADDLQGTDTSDLMSGGTGADVLSGGAGLDMLDGGEGNDRLIGGGGNDIYTVDSSEDLVIEARDAGRDLVKSSVSFVLPKNTELLELTGTDHIDGTGNGGANHILGNAGKNILTGRDGNDTILGNDGADRISGGDERDTLYGGKGHDQIRGGNGSDFLIGGDGDDRLFGDNGSDTFEAGLGRNTMTGGNGPDLFLFDYGEWPQRYDTSAFRIDVITDFSRADGDIIDLSAVDAIDYTSFENAFVLVDPPEFMVPGQLVFKDGVLYGYTDRDLAPEFAIVLIGVDAIRAEDIVL